MTQNVVSWKGSRPKVAGSILCGQLTAERRPLQLRFPGLGVGFRFAESVFDQASERFEGGWGVVADCLQSQLGSIAGAEGEQVEDAFAVDNFVAFNDPDIGLKFHGQFDEQMGGPRMEPLRIANDN
jgi:hypothetical protein